MNQKNYSIRYDYTTGDSFHTEDRSNELLAECDSDDLSLVNRNLQRILDHYKYYQAMNRPSYCRFDLDRADKDKFIIDTAKDKDWFVKKYDFSIRLESENGKFFQICAPWCGYFETLRRVYIEQNNLPDIELNSINF